MGKQKITLDAFLNRAEATRHAARAITNATAPVPMLGAIDTEPATANLAFGADALALKKLAEETDARADAWLPALEKFLIAAIKKLAS